MFYSMTWSKAGSMAGIYLGMIQKFLIPILLSLLLDSIPFVGVWCDTHLRGAFARQVLLWTALKTKNRQQQRATPRAGDEAN